MTSTTVASHTSQPLNFGPEWLRALSTPDATTTPLPNSGGSASGNIFKFSTTKYRYSKDEILALRANVTERLAEDVRNAILENLKDVESVFRPNIIEPLTLTAPTADEAARMSSSSSFISGRTPGGGGRGGHSSQQSSQQQQQPHESRGGRGGSASANGRGGGTRGRGGRENNFGPNRGNNNGDDNGENSGGGGSGSGGTGEESSAGSSWSRGTGFHNRSAGGTFNNRVRSYDDREQSQPFRRGGGGGGTRQTGEVWRRTRGDDDDNTNDQNDESNNANGPSWNSRSGTNNRPGGSSMDHRTKSSDKWSHKDDRPGQSSSFESNQSSSRGAWRTNSSMSDRDLNARRPPAKRDRMPEWMDDNNDSDGQMSGATFDQNGTFTGPSTSTARSNNTNNSNESTKLTSQSSSEEITSQPSTTTTTSSTTMATTSSTSGTNKTHEETKPDKSTPPRTDTAVVNVPSVSETIVPKATPPVEQTIASWDDDFEPSDVATTVVEATLADDHDYSPPVSSHPTPHPLVMEPTPPTMPIIPQVQRSQPAAVPVQVPSVPSQPVAGPIIDDKQWFYRDPQNTIQGPFSSADMERWFAAGYFTVHLPVKRMGETQFSTIQQLIKELGRLPFRSDVPSLPPPPPPANQPVVPTSMQGQSSISENQKFNLMNFPTGTSSNSSSSVGNTYLEDFLLQQQSRQNIHPSMLFNRQTSMPSGNNERKPSNSSSMVSPHMQGFFPSQAQQQQQQQQQQQHHQSSSSLFSNNLVNDPSVAFQHQVPQLQRSISATNNQPLFDDMQRSFRGTSSSTTAASSGFFASTMSSMGGGAGGSGASQQPDDIITRLAHAMQSHGQQQQEKAAAIAEQQRRELELQERLKLAQVEQARLREEEERRRLEEDLRKKQEAAIKKQMILEQMKEMNKNVEQKKVQQTAIAPPQTKAEIDPFLALQQSMQFQKEQQAKIEAQKAENVRRYQQQLREQSHPSPPIQPQQTFKLPETVGWARQSSQSHEQIPQPLNFAEIQKQEQEQERRAREAALAAQQLAKSETNNSSSNQKGNSWARTLFAGGSNVLPSTHLSLDHDINESHQPESPITSFNQQATNAPKSRSTEKHPQSAPWNTSNTSTVNTSLQDIQRQQQQQLQNEAKQQQQQQQQQSQSHSNSSTPAWGGLFSHSNSSSQSMFWADQTNASSSATAIPAPAPALVPLPPPSSSTSSSSSAATAATKSSSSNSGNKSSTPWTDVKSSSTNSGTTNTSSKSNSNNAELSKSEREAKCLFNTTRTQDALSKWAQTQFKDNLQAIDVPTLVQLLKDIDSAEEIVEYVQPYIGSVSKSREFARDFLAKRKQLANAEPELDNERLNALAMAPTSSNANSQNAGDEGFQVASSNGQKKKAKKMKGQKIDVKQLGFMVNNRPEQRDDIDRVQM